MCGIAGFVGLDQPGLIESMTNKLHHRGPDDSGHFVERDVALGHRRLSIIDISGGHQPMLTDDDRYAIVYNGEIYNYKELRKTLIAKGHSFSSESDTEVLLKMYVEYGAGALRYLNGMFAFAIYDRKDRELFLARDRVGIKPLYYMQLGQKLFFASESKAFYAWSGWSKEINYQGVSQYLALRYVPGPTTLVKAVKRLPAAHYMIYKNGQASMERFWSPPTGETKQKFSSENEATDAVGALLETSIRRRLVSDVPLGAYLSGGLDSSMVVALMARGGSNALNTFSVGFDYKHDELHEAEQTASLLGCNHHTIQCGPEDLGLLSDVVYHSDDPLGDPISLPMFKLAHEAKKKVTVILTGEGADEFFGGYLFHKVLWLANIYRKMSPRVFRRFLVHPLVRSMPASMLNLVFKYPADLGQRGKQKVLDYHHMIDVGDVGAEYRHLISLFDQRDTEGLFAPDLKSQLLSSPDVLTSHESGVGSHFDQMLRLQFEDWLPDNMLLRQDKMSMAGGIEGRVPFLDHELVEFAFTLPRKYHLRRLVGKYCLRSFAKRLLPAETAKRRKMPFYVPFEGYYGHSIFKEMMEDLLSDSSIEHRGIFNTDAISRLKTGIHKGEFIQAKQVFSLMTLELWFRRFVDNVEQM